MLYSQSFSNFITSISGMVQYIRKLFIRSLLFVKPNKNMFTLWNFCYHLLTLHLFQTCDFFYLYYSVAPTQKKPFKECL